MTIATFYFAGMLGGEAIEAVSSTLFLKVMKWSFLTFAAISVAGIFFSYQRGKIHR